MNQAEMQHHVIFAIKNLIVSLIETWNRAGCHVLGLHVWRIRVALQANGSNSVHSAHWQMKRVGLPNVYGSI